MNCSCPGSSVHGIFLARILEWVAIFTSRGPSQPRDGTPVSCVSCTGRLILYHCTTRECIHWLKIGIRWAHFQMMTGSQYVCNSGFSHLLVFHSLFPPPVTFLDISVAGLHGTVAWLNSRGFERETGVNQRLLHMTSGVTPKTFLGCPKAAGHVLTPA